jgi:mRNA interferase MazF
MQRGSINPSRFHTVVIVPLTKQTKHAHIPGNVLLQKGEANLPRPSLARRTQIMVIDKSRLTGEMDALSKKRTKEIIDYVIWILGR